MAMIRVAVGDKHFRTKSVDRVARRLYGPKASAVVQVAKDGHLYGMLVTPDKHNPSILVVRDHFQQELDKLPTGERRPKPSPTNGKTLHVVTDDEGHRVSVYR